MRHQPGVEYARRAAGEPEQQVEFAFGESLRPVDTLIADDEVTLVGVGAGKRALGRQGVEKALDLGLGALPGRRSVMFQQHPARALLDARRHEQRQSPCREVLPVADTAARAERARAHAGLALSERAIMPAAAPQEPKVSIRPRSRSNACTRG